jgi:NAD(P)-dependent dehydrogenase (short-subunit alcohol dehydrogenase family)
MTKTNRAMPDVAGKTIFITGGASGIGLSTARAFGKAGARVAIADIDAQAVERARATLAAEGLEAFGARLDVANLDNWETAVSAAEAALGPVRILHSNAGVAGAPSRMGAVKGLEDVEPKDWNWLMGVNVTGALYGLKTLLPRFKAASDQSHVVFTASMAGITPQSALVPGPYTISKYALVGLSDHLRMELTAFPNIGLSVLCPGVVRTNIGVTSGRFAPDADLSSIPEGGANAALIGSGMDPDAVGRRVLQGVQSGDYYIFTHAEYRPLVETYHAGVMHGFGPSAEPGHVDELPALTW